MDTKFGSLPGDQAITRRAFLRTQDVTLDHVRVPASDLVARLPGVTYGRTAYRISGSQNPAGFVSADSYRTYASSFSGYRSADRRVVGAIRELATAVMKGTREQALEAQTTARLKLVEKAIEGLEKREAKLNFYALGDTKAVTGVARNLMSEIEAATALWSVDPAKTAAFTGAVAAMEGLRKRFSDVEQVIADRAKSVKDTINERLGELDLTTEQRNALASQLNTAYNHGGWRFRAAPPGQGDNRELSTAQVLDHVMTYGEVFAARNDNDPAMTPIRSYPELKTFADKWGGKQGAAAQ